MGEEGKIEMNLVFYGILIINIATFIILFLYGGFEYSDENRDFWKEMLKIPWRAFKEALEEYNIIGSAILTWFVLWIYPAAFCAGILWGLIFLLIWIFNSLFKKKK